MHFHLPGPHGSPLEMALRPASYRHFELIERLRATVQNGVTTARDLMGIDAGVRDAVAAGLIEGPRLLVAIDMLSQTSGHADFHIPCGLDLTPLVGGSWWTPSTPPVRGPANWSAPAPTFSRSPPAAG